MRISSAGMILVSICVISGCGSSDGLERVPLLGHVTVQGEPLPGALLQFLPQEGTPGQGALGVSDESGQFEVISSREQDEGVPPGEYTVRVSRLVNPDGTFVPAEAPEADYPDSRESIPPPYSSVDSPLTVTISAEGADLLIEIPEPLNVPAGAGK